MTPISPPSIAWDTATAAQSDVTELLSRLA
jgi:hypothetical protein